MGGSLMIKIVDLDRHFAQNGPTGITITTGTRYFAATLLQEYYEFWKYAFWFYAVPVLVGAAAAFAFGPMFALAGLAVMLLVAMRVIPFNLDERELTGQAIEIAAIANFYGRPDMESEYRLQARSMVRSDSSYKQKGYWPKIRPIDPEAYTNAMALAYEPNASIDAMVKLLKTKKPFAESYVEKHRAKLEKWRPWGDEDHGY